MTDINTGVNSQKTAGAYRIASHLRNNNYSCKVIDHVEYLVENYTNKFAKLLNQCVGEHTRIIGLSGTFMNYEHDAKTFKFLMVLLKSIKKKYPKLKVVIGGNGSNISYLMYFSQGVIDERVHGLAEVTVLRMLENYDNYKLDLLANEYDFHNCIPTFDREDCIQDGEVLPLELSRGCRFKCKFCAYPLLGRNPNDERYLRTTESIVRELVHNYENFKTTEYFITCDTFNETTKKLLHIKEATEIAGIDINFSAYLRLELLRHNPEQLHILKDLGIKTAFFGIESLHGPSAKAIGKGLGTERTIETLHDIRNVWGNETLTFASFILGLPHETEQTAQVWLNMLDRGEVPLHSWRVRPLYMRLENPDLPYKQQISYKSEFESNPKKYGYNVTQHGWTNDVWDSESCAKMANEWTEHFVHNRQIHVDSWFAMAMRNYKMPWKDILNLKWSDAISYNQREGARWNANDGEIHTGKSTQWLQDYRKIYLEQYANLVFDPLDKYIVHTQEQSVVL